MYIPQHYSRSIAPSCIVFHDSSEFKYSVPEGMRRDGRSTVWSKINPAFKSFDISFVHRYVRSDPKCSACVYCDSVLHATCPWMAGSHRQLVSGMLSVECNSACLQPEGIYLGDSRWEGGRGAEADYIKRREPLHLRTAF